MRAPHPLQHPYRLKIPGQVHVPPRLHRLQVAPPIGQVHEVLLRHPCRSRSTPGQVHGTPLQLYRPTASSQWPLAARRSSRSLTARA
eukprot:4974970-Pyramimonas_sp.AAC.1